MRSLKLLLLGASLTALTGCGKSDNKTTGPTITNTVVIQDNGTTYTAAGKSYFVDPSQLSGDFVDCGVQKLTGVSYFLLDVHGPNFQFDMSLDVGGPANGLGAFEFQTEGGDYKELFQGGEAWKIDHGKVTVTSSSNTKVAATMDLYLKSGSKSKHITGSVDINEVRPL